MLKGNPKPYGHSVEIMAAGKARAFRKSTRYAY